VKATVKLDALQRRLNYHFQDKTLLQQALTHKSASFKHNERLEFLGDAILNFVIADLLYQQFDNATEGELTRARASLVNKTTLSEIALELHLSECLHLGVGEQRSGGFRRESILADAVEALICAIYLDAGFTNCRQCIQQWYATRIEHIKPKDQEKDPKTRLQEWLQANGKPLPTYQVVSILGEPHQQLFSVKCEIDSLGLVVEGSGVSRRIAEQQAAYKILELIANEIE
jgi:ribonuclease III